MKTKKLTNKPGNIFLGKGFAEDPLFFVEPQRAVEARSAGEIMPALQKVEQLSRDGYYCAGFISYEAGPALLGINYKTDNFPFLWFGVYEAPKKIKIEPSQLPPAAGLELESELDFENYCRGFSEIKKQIKAGNTYQINYTFRTSFETEMAPTKLFTALYHRHPVPYAAYISARNYEILSMSPELFLRRRGDRLITRPMKGTAPRSDDYETDRIRRTGLLRSEKERAENLMIVDLMRNDLGKLAKIGSVEVPELFTVEQYKTVYQMVSAVEARIADCGLPQIIRAMFPSGSITGAPKRSSIEIIDRVEKTPRRIYTGAVGLVEPGADFCFNIAIRTALFDNKTETGELGIGGGIVSDGIVEDEWREAWLKSKFISDLNFGFSLLETMRYCPRRGIELLPLHLKRLQRSAAYFSIPVDIDKLRRQLTEKLKQRTEAATVRLLAGEGGDFKIEVKDLPPRPAAIKIKLAPRHVSDQHKKYFKHKTTYRSFYNKYRRKAAQNGCFEYVFYDEDGYISEGTISNVYIKKGNDLLTPPLSENILPGVMRQELLRRGAARPARIHRKQIKSACEVYLSNALRGLLKVDKIEHPEKPAKQK
ncbi:MAG: chorismate-binding protein [bacterium]